MKNLKLKVNNLINNKLIPNVTTLNLKISQHFSTALFLKNPLFTIKNQVTNNLLITNTNKKYLN